MTKIDKILVHTRVFVGLGPAANRSGAGEEEETAKKSGAGAAQPFHRHRHASD